MYTDLAESMNYEGKYLSIDGKTFKSHQAFGLCVTTFVKLVAKRLRNVTHVTPTENTTVKWWKQKKYQRKNVKNAAKW